MHHPSNMQQHEICALKNLKALMADLKLVHGAVSEEASLAALCEFGEVELSRKVQCENIQKLRLIKRPEGELSV